jgi:hypothetical protein
LAAREVDNRTPVLPLSVVEDKIPEPTVVFPANKFNSAAVEVIAVPAICSVVALTSPEEP